MSPKFLSNRLAIVLECAQVLKRSGMFYLRDLVGVSMDIALDELQGLMKHNGFMANDSCIVPLP